MCGMLPPATNWEKHLTYCDIMIFIIIKSHSTRRALYPVNFRPTGSPFHCLTVFQVQPQTDAY